MRLFVTIVFFFFVVVANATKRTDSTQAVNDFRRPWYFPHLFPVQFAGHIGLLSAGVGYETRKQNYQLALVYGFVPASIGGVNVHSVTAKNTFPLYRIVLDPKRLIIPYGAIGLNVEIGGKSFLTLPANMPAGYYDFPKSTHLIASIGVKYKHVMERRAIRAVESTLRS